jgi:hypothetical protein
LFGKLEPWGEACFQRETLQEFLAETVESRSAQGALAAQGRFEQAARLAAQVRVRRFADFFEQTVKCTVVGFQQFTQSLAESLLHFTRRLASESDGKDAVKTRTVQQQAGQACYQLPGLAGARRRQHAAAACGVRRFSSFSHGRHCQAARYHAGRVH